MTQIQRETAGYLDKLALFIVGEININAEPPTHDNILGPVVQYWTSQSNTSAIFATVLGSIFVAIFVSVDLDYWRWASAPFFVGLIYFTIRAWAFNRCARIACSRWK
jgi:hypothetical protein